MRDIKFRAWHTKQNCWWYFDLAMLMVGNTIITKDHLRLKNRCQYIGLKDKNDIEIYEGDIITGWKKGSNSDRGYTGEVKWNQQSAGFYILCGKFFIEIISLAQSGDGEFVWLDSFEVIGNIHENPDLLTAAPDLKTK